MVAIIGGTGTLGRALADVLRARGHDVRVVSRHSPDFPADLTTGEGLDAAVQGCDVVVDASNGPSSGKAAAVLVDGSRRLLEAEARAGVGHHVCVSIVGIDEVPMAYYKVKVAQERVVEQAAVPWTIVRATQFHDLLAGRLQTAARFRVAPALKARFQPVEVREVAAAVADVALGAPRRGRVNVAGPEVHDLRELGRIWRAATGRRALPVPVPLLGRAWRAMGRGALTCAAPDVRGTITFAQWLDGSAGAARSPGSGP
jgi:uncharacterized protein YbjT (DUF2867 family)